MSIEISQETGRERIFLARIQKTLENIPISPISCMLLQISIGSGPSNKDLQTSLYLGHSV